MALGETWYKQDYFIGGKHSMKILVTQISIDFHD